MKAGIIAFISILVLLLTGSIIYTVSGRNIRKSELEKSLSNAIEQTMEVKYLDHTYPIRDQEELIADLTGNLFAQISSDADIEIRVKTIDFENGCMDVEAIEHFKYFTGKVGEIAVRKTVIFEQFQDPNDKFYQVTFLDKDGTLFRQIQVYHEGRLTAPQPEPANLIRWELTGDSAWDGDFGKIIVTEDMTFRAVCS